MTPWSVTAQAVWPMAFTMPGRSRMRQAPSNKLNSVWTCKWTKDIANSCLNSLELLANVGSSAPRRFDLRPAVGAVLGDVGRQPGSVIQGSAAVGTDDESVPD